MRAMPRLAGPLVLVVALAVTAAPALSGHDQVPPKTKITHGPPSRTTDRTPTFKFKSNEKKVIFKCKRDGKRFKECRSPLTVKRPLSYGRHGFYVRAIDKFGNRDETPAGLLFKVVRP
jgi:hypothetical protein